MQETIDLIAHRELRNLKRYTRDTGQPTSMDQLDLEPMTMVQNIEIDEEHITIKYNEKIERNYNANTITHREWVFKYNDDPEMVMAIRGVIELARKHLTDLAGERGVSARLRGMLQRLRALRQQGRRGSASPITSAGPTTK